MSPKPSLQERLASHAVLGLVQTVPNLALTEVAAFAGYDFVILDSEHGLFSDAEHLHALIALTGTGTAAFIRLRGHDIQALGRYLDMGADGILVPNVSTAEEGARLVRAMDFPPAGTRGYAGPAARRSRYGADLPAWMREPRGGALLAVMIETARGVAEVEAIAALDGVDAVVIGPFDLSADLGCPGQFSDHRYAEAVARIERAVSAHGKLVGTAPHPGYPLASLLARGHRFITLGADMPLVRQAMTAQLAAARSGG